MRQVPAIGFHSKYCYVNYVFSAVLSPNVYTCIENNGKMNNYQKGIIFDDRLQQITRIPDGVKFVTLHNIKG